MIFFENEAELETDFDLEAVAILVTDEVLKEEGCPKKCQIDLLITDEETVHEINREYRDVDRTTDVLSFPNVEWDAPSDFECEGFRDEFLEDPETHMLMLGQIVLCKERILSQAMEYGHSIKREYAFLIAHSMLHLLGYDHMNEDEAKIMEEKQKSYLSNLSITRD